MSIVLKKIKNESYEPKFYKLEFYSKKIINTFSKLHTACIVGDFKNVIECLHQGDNINDIYFQYDFDRKKYISGNPLIFTIRHNNFKIAEFLVKNGANINCVLYNNTTPIIESCRYQRYEMVDLLLKNGAYADYYTEGGLYCTHSARLLIKVTMKPVSLQFISTERMKFESVYKILLLFFSYDIDFLTRSNFSGENMCLIKKAFIENGKSKIYNVFRIILIARENENTCLFYKDLFPLDIIKVIYNILIKDLENAWFVRVK